MHNPPTTIPIGEDVEQREEELNRIAQEIIDKALVEIRRKYDENGENPKAYHNSLHTNEVMDRIDALLAATNWDSIFAEPAATKNLGPLEGMDHSQKINSLTRVLKMAAAAHDVIQDYSHIQGENELRSANLLAAHMQGKFSETEIEWAKTAILATMTTIERVTTRESHLKQNLPKTATPLARLCAAMLCDADIGNLGSEWEKYYRNMGALYKEIFPAGTPENWRNFLTLQLDLLKTQTYHTEAGEKVFSAVNRERNRQRVGLLIKNL